MLDFAVDESITYSYAQSYQGFQRFFCNAAILNVSADLDIVEFRDSMDRLAKTVGIVCPTVRDYMPSNKILQPNKILPLPPALQAGDSVLQLINSLVDPEWKAALTDQFTVQLPLQVFAN